MRRLSLASLLLALLLGGCASRAPQQPARQPATTPRVVSTPEPVVSANKKGCANCPTPDPDYAPDRSEVPGGIENTPDAVPLDEPRSRYGNPETYDALGKRYRVMPELPRSFRESGRASWYGKKFHGKRTANGETYDMFKMSAAHKTLPIPAYARVTNLNNGRSVVVRINDRGPFHPGRIVDLSYAAAAKLDLLHSGSAEVELEVISPQQGRNAAERGSGKPRYLEVGRFADAIDALALRDRLVQLGFNDSELLQTANPAGDGTDNILRIGPFGSFSKLEAARIKLGIQKISAIPVSN